MDWPDLVQKVGFPVAMVIFFCMASVAVARYVAAKVVGPLVGAHLGLIKALKDFVVQEQIHNTRQENWNDAWLSELREQTELLHAMHKDLRAGQGCRHPGGDKSNESPNRPT